MDNLIQTLIQLEKKYGGYVDGVPRRKVSAKDPRRKAALAKGGIIGGDRMAPEHHNYAPRYAENLIDKIGKRIVLVEVGILKGTGLAIWSDLFSADSRVIGLDVDLSHFADNRANLESLGAFTKKNIEFHEFDQLADNNRYFIEHILRGEKIDVVIDDGCHFDDAIIKTMRDLWPFLADEFVYFVEDNKRFIRIFKDQLRKELIEDFPKLSVTGGDGMTVIKDASLAQWCKKYIGYLPDYKNPRSFNEKIGWKKLHDRNPMLTMTADKWAVRRYVKNCLGSDDILKPMLYVTDDPDLIPFDVLPENYIVKPNHMSGAFVFVRGDADREDIVCKCKKWLSSRYAPYAKEWSYENIEPKIIIENLIENTPDSYKLHVFGGKCEYIQLSQGSIEDKHTLTFTMYNMDWKKLDVRYVHPSADPIPRPAFIDTLVEYAEKLAAPFDYARIDFCVGDKIYFEEITHYPVSGHAKIKPLDFDYEMGSKWKINPYYWVTDWPKK